MSPPIRRALNFVVFGLVAELALRFLAWRAPVFRSMIQPLYAIVAGAFLIGILVSLRPRSGHDRRHGDRRVG